MNYLRAWVLPPSGVAGADDETWRYWALENEANAYALRRPDESYDPIKEVQIQGERAEAYLLQLYKI